MITTKEVVKKIIEVDKVLCNKCGREIGKDNYESYISLHTTFGFGSPRDGDEIHLHLCNECMEEFANSCKINPIVEID